MMISAGLMMLAMASCDQTEYREITEDRVVPQPVDTIKVADHFYLDGYLSRTSENIGGKDLNAVNLFSDGEELYVANFAGKCIDVFDAETLELKRSMSNGDRTLARDVYVEGDHLFVAAGDSREVQIFDKKTGKYLSRLGTGSWSASNVSWAGCVCATPRLVFVRDSKEKNIRVFDREALDMNAASNNNVYAKLATGSNFIGSKFEPQSESYDMEAIGDSLYSFIPRTGTIYAWKVQDIIEKKMRQSRLPRTQQRKSVPSRRPTTRRSSSYRWRRTARCSWQNTLWLISRSETSLSQSAALRAMTA